MLHAMPCILHSQYARGFGSNEFNGFNQVLLASSSLRKGLINLFYPNAIEYAKDSLLNPGVSRMDLFRDYDDSSIYYMMEVHSSRDSFPSNIQSSHFQLFVSRCEDILTKETELTEFKSLYPPKVMASCSPCACL
jgi:quinol monooxygenase YgiN